MPETSITTRPINFNVTRYNPERDRNPYVQTYTIPVRAGTRVLDGLHYIKENLDASLALALFVSHGPLWVVRNVPERPPHVGLQHPDPAHREYRTHGKLLAKF